MNLRQLECFIAVARHLSFTRAAEELGIAQPPLSQHIRRLEDTFGVSLFHRTKHAVELTDIGRAFLPRAKSLLQQAQIARYEIMEMAGLGPGHLRVGASGTLAAFCLPDLVADFQRKHANVSVHIVQQRSEAVLAMLEAGELDIGILRLPLKDTPLEVTKLTSEPLYAALPPHHPAASKARLSLDELRSDPFVMCVDKREPFYSIVSNLCVAAGFVPNVICAGAEYTTVFRLVGMGVGVSVTSKLATNLSVTPSPIFVRIDNPDAIISTAVVVAAKALRTDVVTAFHALTLMRLRAHASS